MKKNKPSRTAAKVAFNLLTLSSKPGMENLMPPGLIEATEQLLVASGVTGKRTIRWMQSQRMVVFYEWFNWMLPGQFEAFAHRKAFCERQVRAGIDEGATQILVFGAGYDTLGWRLAPEFPDVNFFEIDHPATARLKKKGIETMGERDNLFLIAEDLGKNKLIDILSINKSWDKGAQAVIIAEGLMMYLSPEAVRDLFCQCEVITGVDSRIAFSYIPSGRDGRLDAGRWTGLMLWLQKVAGEPWLWSIELGELGPYLEECGWKMDSEQNWAGRKYGVEYFVMAERAADDMAG
jgi:methyltransferase (TIGR00027 family)